MGAFKKDGLFLKQIDSQDTPATNHVVLYANIDGEIHVIKSDTSEDLLATREFVNNLVAATSGSGQGFTPLSGTGITITPSGDNYTFSVTDYISSTNVTSLVSSTSASTLSQANDYTDSQISGISGVADVNTNVYANGTFVSTLELSGGIPTSLVPDASGSYDLGSSKRPFKDLYLTDNTIYFGNNAVNVSSSGFIVLNNNKIPKENIQPFNVKFYGAVGDGITDDTLSIQAAIDAASGSGYIAGVYLPHGNYRVSSSLQIRSNTHIHGEGIVERIDSESTSGSAFSIFTAQNVNYWSIRGITIKNIGWDNILLNGVTTATSFGNWDSAIDIDECSHWTVRDCDLIRCSAGIIISNSDYWNCDNVQINANTSKTIESLRNETFTSYASYGGTGGILVQGERAGVFQDGCRGGSITNCRCIAVGLDVGFSGGVQSYNVYDVSIRGCEVHGTNHGYISYTGSIPDTGATSTSRGVEFESCRAFDCYHNGFYVRGVAGVTVKNCHAKRCGVIGALGGTVAGGIVNRIPTSTTYNSSASNVSHDVGVQIIGCWVEDCGEPSTGNCNAGIRVDAPRSQCINNKVFRSSDVFKTDRQNNGTGILIFSLDGGNPGELKLAVFGNEVYGFQYGISMQGSSSRSDAGAGEISISNNDCYECGYGIILDPRVTGIQVEFNRLKKCSNAGLYLRFSPKSVIRANTFSNNPVGIDLRAGNELSIFYDDSVRIGQSLNIDFNTFVDCDSYIDVNETNADDARLINRVSTFNGNTFDGKPTYDGHPFYGTSIPQTFNRRIWNVGEEFLNSSLVAGGHAKWICVTPGQYGTLSGVTVEVASGSNQFLLNTAAGVVPGAHLNVDGLPGTFEVTSLNTSGSIIATVDVVSVSAVSGASVSYQIPQFEQTETLNLNAAHLNLHALGTDGVKLGNTAGQNVIISGLENVSIGENSLGEVEGEDYNTSIGNKSMSTGRHYAGTGIGYQALGSASGNNYYNTASGFQSMLYGRINTSTDQASTSFGYQSMRGGTIASNNTGHSNTGMGSRSLYNLISGNYNSALGNRSLFNVVSGSGNVGLGYNAGLGANTDGSIYIGYQITSPSPANYDLVIGYDTSRIIYGTNINDAIGSGGSDSATLNLNADVTIAGDLYVNGTEFITDTEHVSASDNIITLNAGEVGAGVTAGTAGIEIDRGSDNNYQIVFRESDDTFVIGEEGSLQVVATREDSPTDGYVAQWNSSANRFDTVDPSTLNVNTDSLPVYNVVEDYNADNTGASDTYSSINNALTAIVSAGEPAILYFPTGTYSISSGNLEVLGTEVEPIYVIGNGIDNTIFNLNFNGATSRFFRTQSPDFSFSDFTINGSSGSGEGIWIFNTDGSAKVERIKFTNLNANAVDSSSSADAFINECVFENISGYAIDVGDRAIVSNCEFVNCQGSINSEGDDVQLHNNRIRGNSVSDAINLGATSSNNSIQSNTIQTSAEALNINGSNNIVVNNHFNGLDSTTVVNVLGSDHLINDNYFNGNLLVDATANNIVATDNMFSGNSTFTNNSNSSTVLTVGPSGSVLVNNIEVSTQTETNAASANALTHANAYTDQEISGISLSAQTVAVSSIDDPSYLLNNMSGDFKGQLLICYETFSEPDEHTIYFWDNDDVPAPPENVPYVINGNGGVWVSTAGKHGSTRLTANGSNISTMEISGGIPTSLVPDISGAYDLGSPELPFKDLYLTNNSMHLGDDVVSSNNGTIEVNSQPLMKGTKTISASAPSGGQDGDVWYQV